MQSTDPNRIDAWRVVSLAVVMLAGLTLLVAALYREQVLRHQEHAGRHERQSIRRVLLPAVRGRILDRRGQVLADNRPSYCVAVYMEELRRPGPWRHTINAVDHLLDRLSAELDLPRTDSIVDIETHIRRRLPLPYLAWRDLDTVALARLAERAEPLPGVDIYVQPERHYPLRTTASHVIGYVGRDRPEAPANEPFDFYLPEMRGRIGIERQYDQRLSGVPGGRLIRVDARGYKHQGWAGREAVPGRDVKLTLDLALQRRAESELQGRRGAAVVLDVRNGEVLALASMPVFDLTRMSPAPSAEHWQRLLADAANPLFHRAITGTYPPGSTFKPVVALAALEHPGFNVRQSYRCEGAFDVGGRTMRCWRRSGHGALNLADSLKQSCNVYYFYLSLEMGYDRLYRQAEALGFGSLTGIDLPGEVRGLLPGPAWKRQARNESWWAGDTCNVSIGQGAVLVTPLQMAVFAMMLANDGIVHRPRLVKADRHVAASDPMSRLQWSAEGLAAIRQGMRDAVQSASGTARQARIAEWEMAGKTGTAQYGAGRIHAWMIAYAPLAAPRYAVAVLVENVEGGGGADAGPIIGALMRELVRIESRDADLSSGSDA